MHLVENDFVLLNYHKRIRFCVRLKYISTGIVIYGLQYVLSLCFGAKTSTSHRKKEASQIRRKRGILFCGHCVPFLNPKAVLFGRGCRGCKDSAVVMAMEDCIKDILKKIILKLICIRHPAEQLQAIWCRYRYNK